MIKPLVCLLLSVALATAAEPRSIEPFRLPDTSGRAVDVNPTDELTVVCFLGTECPLAKLYGPRLSQLSRELPQVRFVGVNSNRQDTTEELRAYGDRYEISFALLKDHHNQIADRFQAERTPEVFVLDDEFTIRYQGRIDDQYEPGVARKQATREDLREAIKELLANKPVSHPITDPQGCFIGRVRKIVQSSDITYCGQVARIFQRNCVECHREGEIGPFCLDEYEAAVGWADTILEVIDNGRMPPWHANPKHGKFQNARHLAQRDKDELRKWVEAGMPFGDPAKLPEPFPSNRGWRLLRDPDLVLTMSDREFMVPADGTLEYQYFVVDPGFEEDKWITGAQIIPGNSSVVHHSIVFVRPPDGARFRGIGWLTAYVPGSPVGAFPPGSAIMVPAESKLVFQQHYTPTGTEQSDITKIGITFGDERDITHEVYSLVGIEQEFEIPPNTRAHKVHSKMANLPEHATLRAVMPHMHLRGRSFRLFANKAETTEVLLDVPNYDFNWQHAYRFQEPIPLSTIDALEFDVTFDNSTHNPVNPDPNEYVTWGDQTWEEMAVAFFEVTEPREQPEREPEKTTKLDVISPEVQRRMSAQADRVIAAFDENSDGVVGRYETPFAFRRNSFGEIDRDGDNIITREEIEKAARWRVQ